MVVSEIVAATFIYICGLRRAYRIILRGERRLRAYLPLQTKAGPYYSLQRRFLRRVFKAIHSAIQYTQRYRPKTSFSAEEKETSSYQKPCISPPHKSLYTRENSSPVEKREQTFQRGIFPGVEDKSKQQRHVRLQVKERLSKEQNRSESDEPQSRAL
eukprot:jgi/Galph1/1338/GphlegSOOS_G6062.1